MRAKPRWYWEKLLNRRLLEKKLRYNCRYFRDVVFGVLINNYLVENNKDIEKV